MARAAAQVDEVRTVAVVVFSTTVVDVIEVVAAVQELSGNVVGHWGMGD